MKRDVDHGRLEDLLKNDELNRMLGKRHEYRGAARQELRVSARKLGFSPAEISELERVYSDVTKGPQR